MKRHKFINTQSRIIFLLSILIVFMISIIYYLRETSGSHVNMLVKEEESESTVLLAKIVNFRSEELKTFSKDYTYWDEMVGFTETHDTSWGKVNIEVSLPTYHTDLVWVFDKNFKRFYFAAGENITQESGVKPAGSIPPGENAADLYIGLFPEQMLRDLFTNSRFCHFFIKTSQGIVEISGASIHPTSDPERQTEPRGYFMVGRLWTPRVLEEIGGFTSSEISIREVPAEHTVSSTEGNHIFTESVYIFTSWDQKPLAALVSVEQEPLAALIIEESNSKFGLILIFSGVFLGFLGLSLYYLLNRPLRMISYSLKENDISYISGLLNKQDEFGEMSRLVNEFFLQKNKLLKEVNERTEAENKARISEIELRNSLNEKVILLKEVHHRVKNNLQIIVSLIRLQSETTKDPDITGHLHTILSRIRSIAFVHEMLYRSADLGSIDFNEYLRKFTITLKDIYAGSDQDIEIDVDAEGIRLGVDLAVPCGIIINELVTNSIKHAFKKGSCGVIKVSMKESEGVYTLKVSDNGESDPDLLKMKSPASLGMYLVTSLADQLEARLDISPGKCTAFTLTFSGS
jgi:two-component sensor histidine kinase